MLKAARYRAQLRLNKKYVKSEVLQIFSWKKQQMKEN